MISLIVCSRKSDISIELKENIQNTIAVEYELIVIDNSKKIYSISSAYNEGVRRSNFQYLCFMHDDILYHTNNWGKNVVRHMQDEEVGIIGIAGGHFIPNAPSGWDTTKVCTYDIIQRINKGEKYMIERWTKQNYRNNSISNDAVVVDGVWFCLKKSLFSLISFDENLFKGFHCYDMDICFQVRKSGFSVRIVSDILLEHFSVGSYSNDWVENTLAFNNKWKDYLPQIVGVTITEDEISERTEFATQIFALKNEILRIRKSKAYRLGKFLLYTLSALKKNR